MVAIKRVLVVVVVLALAVGAGFAWMTSIALRDANVLSTDYNPARTCYAQTIDASLDGKVPPILKNLFFLAHSRLFYRIFTKDGELIKSTDWRFLEPTVDTDYARWTNNSTLVYPGDGYQSLRVAQCGKDSR